MFQNNNHIKEFVAKNDFITIAPYKNSKGKVGAFVKHNGIVIGMLSGKSKILNKIKEQEYNSGVLIDKLSGLFVSEVFVWTYEDTLKFDKDNITEFAKYWSQDAINCGFVYIVDFAGYAR